MKKLYILSILLLSYHGIAQTANQIDEICATYDNLIQQSVENELEFYPACITVKSTLNKRAIGPVDNTIKLYFDEHEVIEESEELNETIFLKSAGLRKAIITFESGSYLYTDIFYFDENALLIKFISSELGYECAERMTYFDKNKAIRFIQTPIESDDCLEEEKMEQIDVTKLSNEQIEMADYRLQVAQEYRELLTRHYNIIKY